MCCLTSSIELEREEEFPSLTSLHWLLLEWGPHCPTTPLFRSCPPRSWQSWLNTMGRNWTRRGIRSPNTRSPRSGRAESRVLCIDTLSVLMLGYLFDKGVFVDTQQEVEICQNL